VCCGFIVCFSPYEIMLAIDYGGHIIDYGSWYYEFTFVLIYINCLINPFIYVAKYREFQQGVRRLLSRMKLNQQQSQVSAIT